MVLPRSLTLIFSLGVSELGLTTFPMKRGILFLRSWTTNTKGLLRLTSYVSLMTVLKSSTAPVRPTASEPSSVTSIFVSCRTFDTLSDYLEIFIFIRERDNVRVEPGVGLVEDVVRFRHHSHLHLGVRGDVEFNFLNCFIFLKGIFPVSLKVNGIENEEPRALGDQLGGDKVGDEIIGLVLHPIVNGFHGWNSVREVDCL